MKDKTYLSVGYTSMGIAGSMVDPDFFQDYLGLRTEFVDMSEVKGGMEDGIYDHEEFERAMKWVKEKCIEGPNRSIKLLTAKRKIWTGNPSLK